MGTTELSTIYIKLRRRIVTTPGSLIILGEVALIETDREVAQRLRSLPLVRVDEQGGSLQLIDMLQVVRAIRKVYPHAAIEAYGEPHVLVELSPNGQVKPRRLLLVAVWLLLFFGSGMALMNFHADVNMPDVQRRITQLITGRAEMHPWLFQIPYSFGVGFGMLLFFNRLFRKRLNDEPNPLEVEMFMYQESLNHYAITEEYRKKHEVDRN